MTVSRFKCPTCGRQTAAVPASPWRPFCSERCRLLDLGAWLTERHAIAGDPIAPDDETATERDGS
jgi:hypothetical protein